MRSLALTLTLLSASAALAAPPTAAEIDRQFNQNVRPFVTKNCVGCHSGATPAAQLDLKQFTTVDSVVKDFPHWMVVLDKLAAGQMPPSPIPAPPAEAKKQVMDWIETVRATEAKKHAGDPGAVLARRLSNSEYNYTIRDLTGQDLKPTREFPVDPANQSGFDNSGESLTMSPALLNKYLQAARSVAEHMVLTPSGFDFSPHPMLVETDREKYAIQRIVNFYLSQPTDYADYFEAAWQYKNRATLGKPSATLASLAAESKISAKYLPLVWQILEDNDAVGPTAKLQAMWRVLPSDKDQRRKQTVAMRDFVTRIRRDTAMQFSAPRVRGLSPTSQPLMNWKLLQYNTHRRKFDPGALRNDTEAPVAQADLPKLAGLGQEASVRWAAIMKRNQLQNPDLAVPAAQRAAYEASFAKLANVFPDVFYVSERGRFFPDDSEDKGRLLSAGYHNVMGYWRDDEPLKELILDDAGIAELNKRWDEFDYIGDHTTRTWTQYYFNQSGEILGTGRESGHARPTDFPVPSEPIVMRMMKEYLAKADQPNNDPVALEAIKHHFNWENETMRRVEKMREDSTAKHLDALVSFSERAYRRPLSKLEKDELLAYYKTLRAKSELSHEDAIRDAIVYVLMSPDFLYRVDLVDATAVPVTASAAPARAKAAAVAATIKTSSGDPARALSAYALANRLSYFIWASAPDKELLAKAANGDLLKTDVLLAQTRRLLKDPKSEALATEFGGNWLDFRRFEDLNSVDRERFPAFTNDLREAMYQEPIKLISDVIRNDRSVLDLVYGKYTFVNPVLAKHYGMPEVKGTNDTWVRVDNADQYSRGGVLPMAAFLTQNSPGLRTSPVKRGYWVVRRVLGETIPAPPPNVPELPKDESKMERPLREVLAMHRANPLCGSCHARFDTFGLALESYGPVGDLRQKDLAGRAIDPAATFPGGSQGVGLEGIRTYIKQHREKDFTGNISRKLLSYALGRTLQMSDELTIDKMNAALAANGYRFAPLVETIVTSQQFLTRRAPVKISATVSKEKKGE